MPRRIIVVSKKEPKAHCGELEGSDYFSPADNEWASKMVQFEELKSQGKSIQEIAVIMGVGGTE